MRTEIEFLDAALAGARDLRPGWRVHKKVRRVQETSLGELSFTRRYYHHPKSGTRAFLSDLLVGVEKHERIERELKAALCNQVAKHSYQESAARCSGGRISKQSVMRLDRELELPERPAEKVEESATVLHIQADEDHVSMQDGRRGSEVKLAVFHEPAYRVGKKGVLAKKHHVFSHKESSEAFWSRVADEIGKRYDLGGRLSIYLHGDGASWIKQGLNWLPNCRYVLDPFHAMKALRQLAPAGSAEYRGLRRSLLEQDKAAFTRLAEESARIYQKDASVLKEVSRYIKRHWEAIGVWTKDPKSGGSCAEGLVSHCLSERLSSMRPMAWLDEGLECVSRLREYHLNGGTVLWCDFKKKEPKDGKEKEESVRLRALRERYKKRHDLISYPTELMVSVKRDARYRLFKKIIEGGKAI